MRASITRLGTRLTELEDTADQPRTPDHARQLLGKLRSLDEDFWKDRSKKHFICQRMLCTRLQALPHESEQCLTLQQNRLLEYP